MTLTVEEFERRIQRIFLKPDILLEALTHRSYLNEYETPSRDNERLEFLGDAIVDFVAGEMLYQLYPTASEGELTQFRAAIVRAEALAQMANEMGLGDFLRLGHGEEVTGGRTRQNVLADGFEAVVGAIYVDGGMDAAKAFLLPRFAVQLQYTLEHKLHLDARSLLQERAQADLKITPIFRVADIIGKEHEREFILEAVIGDVTLGRGQAPNKRVAAQIAARNTLLQIEKDGYPEELQDIADAIAAQRATESATPQSQ
jgi:ribonuclease-3